MLTYLNMFTALQTKQKECDAHIFEQVTVLQAKQKE